MSYIPYNPNPNGNYVGDCVVRAISKVTEQDWDGTYINLALAGFALKDMPSANHVWGVFLRDRGFKRVSLPDTCPECYSVSEFCEDYPHGRFVLATGTHVIAVVDGNYYDSWDSGDEVPVYFFVKED